MTKITDMIEIHDGVALMVGCHDESDKADIMSRGAMFAYAIGKYGAEHFRIELPQLVVCSTSPQARNTAVMHCNTMLINEMDAPEIIADERLCKQTDKAIYAAVEEAIDYAANTGCKTVEIVIANSKVPFGIARHFGGSKGSGLSTGGMIVLKADSWKDMLAGKTYGQDVISGSQDFARDIFGTAAVDVLNVMSNPTDETYLETLEQNGEAQMIWSEAGINNRKDVGLEEKINLIIEAKQKESVEWVAKVLKGEEVESEVTPIEFMEMYDAYAYWVLNTTSAVASGPDKSADVRLFGAADNLGGIPSKMADKLIELANRARTRSVVFADGVGDGRHPILTIQVQTPAIYHSAGRKSENRPPLNESLADKMRREAQKAAEAKAKAAKRQKTKQKAAN